MISELQNQGNLPGLLSAKAEIGLIKTGGKPSPTPDQSDRPQKLVAAQAIFHNTKKKSLAVSGESFRFPRFDPLEIP